MAHFQQAMEGMGVRPLKGKDDYVEWRGCKLKTQYNEAGARRTIRRMRREGLDQERTLNIYECEWCGGWHVGNRRTQA